jgi:hypothetical protein
LFGAGAFAFETRVVHWTPDFVSALSYLVAALSLGAVWLYYFMIRRAAATRAVSLFYLTPVTALMAFALFGEKLAPLALVGMAVCIVGVFLVNSRMTWIKGGKGLCAASFSSWMADGFNPFSLARHCVSPPLPPSVRSQECGPSVMNMT